MAEESVRDSPAAAGVLEALLAQSAEGVLIARPDGAILRANPAACAALGRSEQDLRRLGRAGLVVPGPRVEWMLEERERTGRVRGEVLLRRADGTSFSAELDSAVVHPPGGDPVAVVVFRDLSAQREVEQRLRESEERLRLFVEHAPAAIAMLDRELRYLAVSRRWMRDYRLSGSVIGRSHYEVFPEVPARWREIHRRCLAGAVETCDEEPFPRADGTIDWVRWEVRPWRTAAGEIGGLVIFSEVITDRKRAEEALRAAEAKYRHLVTASPDAIVVHRDGRAIYANPAALALYGATSLDRLAAHDILRELAPADEYLPARDRTRGAMEGYAQPPREGNVVRLDGRVVPVEVVSCPVDVEGARAVQSVLRDITERKRVEAALRANEEVIARQRAVVEGVARIFREALTCRTEEELGASCLAVAREVTQSPSGFIGEIDTVRRRLTLVARGSPGARGAEAACECGPAREEPEARVSLPLRGLCRRVVVRRASAFTSDLASLPGAEAWAAGTPQGAFVGVPLRLAGRVVGLIGLGGRGGGYRPDQVGAVEALAPAIVQAFVSKRAEEALRVADRRKTDFLAILSHELRNPLAPIRNGVYLLERAPPGSPQALRAKDVIRRQTEQLTGLVDDLLDISRITHGKITLHRERLDAREVIHRACEDQQPAFDERGVALAVSLPDEPLWVDADATRLAQVVTNLLSNAVKFTARSGTVSVALSGSGGACTLRVRDDGEGIEPHLLDHIFEPFAQAERTRGKARGGMGIGLALVKSLATMHGGTVRAESEGPGRGAEFVVSLPRAAAPGAPGAAAPAPAGASVSVLVVEDNRDAGETLRDILQLLGHRARLVTDGPSAIAAFQEERPDAIVCDVGLPGISGYEVVRRIRRLPGGARVLAVALTGYAQPEDVDEARAAGFDAHLAKPPPLEQLEALLARAAAPRR